MSSETVQNQIKKVIELVLEKKRQCDHKFLDTLLKRLRDTNKALNNEKSLEVIKKNNTINGALRAYFDTSLVKSYQEPLVIELDKLEVMLKENV
ncbi:hypothetical protein C6W24_05200 [Bacillus atrophaeus]|uniref:hypothetical protein n=1 Tax=Bacillus atrophaeus TaxID=1452 RepID=UPI000D03C149|nr:hypothetical protein [Bacillus atrophaeus]PRS01642.1 hypothetical protein C6W24_05200 [Bacillus atrophaeus]